MRRCCCSTHTGNEVSSCVGRVAEWSCVRQCIFKGGHCIADCTPTRDQGQSEVKWSKRNFEAGQAVKLGIGVSLRTVKVSPGD